MIFISISLMIKDLEHFLWLLVTCISYFKTFTISSLPVNEHGLSSDLLVSPLISLSKDLQSSVYRFFTSLVKFIPKNFILFAFISKLFSPYCTILDIFFTVNQTVFLVSFSEHC